MSLSIHLLGSPRIERDGVLVEAPRGHKPWGLLTYLVRTRVPSSRERLASLLFPEADDPLGSLRWTSSVLRRQLGDHATLGGDPMRLTLSPGTFLDVEVLSSGSWVQAIALPSLGHELLDGMVFRSSPGFDRPGRDRRFAGLDLGQHHSAGGHPAFNLHLGGCGGREEGRARTSAQLATEEVGAFLHVLHRGFRITGRAQTTHEEDVRVLIEGIESHKRRGVMGSANRVSPTE